MSGIGKKEAGFTLVELMVSMAIAGIVMATIYSSYYSQQKAYVTQEQVSAMQQNLRAAMYHLERDIRMAGYDPTGKAGAMIVAATSASFQFTKDDNNNAGDLEPDGDRDDANENITYRFDAAQRSIRKDPGNQAIAENFDALNLIYLDSDGAPTAPANVNKIRSIQITLVARTSRPDPGYSDPNVYKNLEGATIFTPAGDNLSFRRKMLRAEIRCRNIGI
ncbi:MAG: prepilin-type N-terminal cleavage/methylation domain-containing protein [Desulfobacterales bacterium]|nr:prepilin-type N-terminal cleavage/methylation domain-containing protein [Desulfobacterales bacterium]